MLMSIQPIVSSASVMCAPHTHNRNFCRHLQNLAHLESSKKLWLWRDPRAQPKSPKTKVSLCEPLRPMLPSHALLGWRPNGNGLRQTQLSQSPLRQFIETKKLIITMNRVVLVNTFLNLTSLQFLISFKQLLLRLPPQRFTLQWKIPNSIHSGIKLDLKKLVFVFFFGILPLNAKLNIISDFGFWCSDPPCKND